MIHIIHRVIASHVIFPVVFMVGCTSIIPVSPSPDNNSTGIISGEIHKIVQQGVPDSIKLRINTNNKNWPGKLQFALTTAGPYISHKLTLNSHPLTIIGDGRYTYVATQFDNHDSKNKTEISASQILVIQFTDDGRTKILGKLPVMNDIVTRMAYSQKKIILALKQGGISVVDVSNPTAPRLSFSHFTKSPVLDIRVTDLSTYLLLKNNVLLELNLNNQNSRAHSASLLHSWKLPVPATSIALDNKHIFLAGPQGVASVKLTETMASLIDLQTTSGTPKDILFDHGRVLVADDTGGLVVFQANPNGQLRWLGSYNKRGAITAISTLTSDDQTNVLATLSNGTIISISLTRPELPSSGVVFKPEQPIIAATVHDNRHNTSRNNSVILVTANSVMRVVMTGDGNQLVSPEGVTQGGSRRGVIRENILYVADWFSGLHLYDISNPNKPRHLSNYHTPGSSKGVTLMDHYALIGDDDQGLQIVDIIDPLHPHWVSELSPKSMAETGLAYTMKLVGNILYLADHRGGFHIIDLTNIKQPKRLGGYDTPGKSWGIDVVDHYVFVADDSSGLLVFDARNATQPILVGQFNPDGQAEDVVIKNHLAYVTFFDKGLFILDVHLPQKPRVIGHVAIPGNARGLALDDGLAYVAGWESGLQIVDIRNKQSPRIIGSYDTDGAAWGVIINDGYAYTLDWWGGIKVIDIRTPSKPVVISQYHGRDELQQIRSKDNYLYIASGNSGLQIYDCKNPLNPVWTTGVDFTGNAQDVWLDDDRAYVAAGDGGVIIVDTLDPFYAHRIGQIKTPGQVTQVRAWNDFLYSLDNQAGLIVTDVRDTDNPREIARYPIPIRDIWIDETALWISTAQGLSWWKHQGNGGLTQQDQLAIAGGTYWVRTRDNLVVTAQRQGKISLWNKTAQGLAALGTYQTHEPIVDLQLAEHALYVLGAHSGLMAITISDPRSPRLSAVYPQTGHHTRFELTDNAAFFAGEKRPASVALLPVTTFATLVANPVATPLSQSTHGSNEVEVHLPTHLPIGTYHLLATTPEGHRQLLPNALTVQFASPSQGKSPLETMRQMINSH